MRASVLSVAILGALPLAWAKADPQLSAKLKTADSQLDRLALLPDNKDWKYDFKQSDHWTFSPGSVVTANSNEWATVIGNGLAMAVLNLGPCAMLPIHYHPRASNYVVAVQGKTMTYFTPENGGKRIENVLEPFQMTIFPKGSMHIMVNLGCDKAVLISALSEEDPGTHDGARALFSMPLDLLNNSLGKPGLDLKKISAMVPPVSTGSIAGNSECIAKCKKAKREFTS